MHNMLKMLQQRQLTFRLSRMEKDVDRAELRARLKMYTTLIHSYIYKLICLIYLFLMRCI